MRQSLSEPTMPPSGAADSPSRPFPRSWSYQELRNRKRASAGASCDTRGSAVSLGLEESPEYGPLGADLRLQGVTLWICSSC